MLPKLVLDAAGKVRTRLHRGDGASVHPLRLNALRLGDCCERQGGQSDAPAQQRSEIRCHHLHKIEPRRQPIANAGYGIGDAGNSSSSNTRVIWKAQPMRGTFSQSESYRNRDTLSQWSGDCQLARACNVDFRRNRLMNGIFGPSRFTRSGKPGKCAIAPSQSVLPPPTNG